MEEIQLATRNSDMPKVLNPEPGPTLPREIVPRGKPKSTAAMQAGSLQRARARSKRYAQEKAARKQRQANRRLAGRK